MNVHAKIMTYMMWTEFTSHLQINIIKNCTTLLLYNATAQSNYSEELSYNNDNINKNSNKEP